MILQDAEASRVLLDALLERSDWHGSEGRKAEAFERLLASCLDPAFPGGIVPRLIDDQFVYYLVAPDPAQWRRLAPLAVASVGATLSDFTGVPSEPTEGDTFESELATAGVIMGRVEPTGEHGLRKRTSEALIDLVECLREARGVSLPSLQTTESLLREFDLALAVGDRGSAEGTIARLRSNLRLEGLNFLFLEIQMLAGLEAWDELWAGEFFEDAARTFRPPLVTMALLRATYWASLVDFVVTGDVESAVHTMRELVLPRWGNLTAARPIGKAADAQIPALLGIVAGTTDPWTTEADAETATWERNQRDFVDRLSEKCGPIWLEVASKTGSAALSVEVGDLRADLVTAAVRSDAQALDAIRIRLRQLPDAKLDEVLSHRLARDAWNMVSNEESTHDIKGWLDWAARLPEMDAMAARAWARDTGLELPVEAVLDRGERVKEFSALMLDAASRAEPTIVSVVPSVLEWLSRDPDWPRHDYFPLYQDLLELLLLLPERSQPLVAGVGMLASAVLSGGPQPIDYGRVLGDLGDWVGSVTSVATVDSVLDLAELTVVHPTTEPDARERFWGMVVAALSVYQARLDPIQVGVLGDIDQIISGGQLTEHLRVRPRADQHDDPLAGLEARVGVYTLVDSVGQRVKHSVESAAPNVRVDIATDKVGNERLRVLAREVDVFAIDWSRATHAATDFIRANRGGRGVLYTRGSGSSSISRQIVEALLGSEGEAANAA